MNSNLVCAALLMVLLFGLGFAVSLERANSSKLGGIPTDETSRLFKLIRAHGNASEYVPTGIALALYFSVTASSLVISALITAFTVARYAHAMALIVGGSMNQFSLLRFVGGMGTYISGIGLAFSLLSAALG
ncbi:MAPEG family protein [Aquisediminimonas profunda]|uniref:MAPEG family protein n=1 Tax=Aquisediminimonas profunda TaxID=1550733 RepID=UPI001C63005E|nr:MAPEG family protein [Aquisediminimonas profunda]